MIHREQNSGHHTRIFYYPHTLVDISRRLFLVPNFIRLGWSVGRWCDGWESTLPYGIIPVP